jgi:hypothetical protein
MNYELITVVEILDGLPQTQKSFIIKDETKRGKVQKKVDKLFLKLLRESGLVDCYEDMDDIVEHGWYYNIKYHYQLYMLYTNIEI